MHEVQRTLAERGVALVEGKFEQFNRGRPYASLVQAFRARVQRILTEEAEVIERWKRRLRKEIGANAWMLAEVVPEVRHILDIEPEAERGAALTGRFPLVMAAFVRALASAMEPLVIFVERGVHDLAHRRRHASRELRRRGSDRRRRRCAAVDDQWPERDTDLFFESERCLDGLLHRCVFRERHQDDLCASGIAQHLQRLVGLRSQPPASRDSRHP